jgi:hypothetical protein
MTAVVMGREEQDMTASFVTEKGDGLVIVAALLPMGQ